VIVVGAGNITTGAVGKPKLQTPKSHVNVGVKEVACALGVPITTNSKAIINKYFFTAIVSGLLHPSAGTMLAAAILAVFLRAIN